LDTETRPITALANAVRENVEQAELGSEGATNVGFLAFKLKDNSTITAQELTDLVTAAQRGEFQDETIDRLKQGPSYIELGAWIGDQGLALAFMGLAEILGLGDVISPATLGITDERAGTMMGQGFIMLTWKNS
jgi:hypothetical protein